MEKKEKGKIALEVPVQEQLSKEQAEQLLEKQFILLGNLNLKSSEITNLNEKIETMLEIYSILFPYRP
ncbi:hypothetical protein [Clostridium beijerinckii]|uniref:hypothetical protein n=1 Tax=Clostridium beijerinckii TaxID=1520 RepID=UPI00232FFD52|nr:hypothetical protein [Clostridium beijerinckii]